MSRLTGLAILVPLCFLVLDRTLSADDPPAKPVPLQASELNERPVIGELGIPLGTCADIQAKVIAGRDLRLKQYASAYLLSVTHVGNKRLATPVNLRFVSAPGVSVKLASDGFELHELKTGKKTGTLTDTKIRELEEGYVGKTIKLTVYEVGAFSGIPRKMPEGRIWWADTGFHFSTSLVVISEQE
ncbi:MAG TPA: hypothetical protein VKE40_15850 [Gemmataceae bacterium]|nr:hypothetical protein [Gemmataceae bacterium]